MDGKVVEGFYDSLRKTFLAARLAGVFPVTGLLDKNSKCSRCAWITPYTVYYILTTTSVTVVALLHLYDNITSSRQFRGLSVLILQCSANIALILLLRLSLNWRNMLTKIELLEKLLPPFKNGHFVVGSINRVMMYIALIYTVEHLIYLTFTARILSLCLAKKNEELTMEIYFEIYFGWLLNKIPYNYITALWLQIVRLQTTFLFQYIDALVIAVTLYLVHRFQNFNRLMKLTLKKCNQNTQWFNVQAHYTRLTQLVKTVDDHINPMVFLSFLCNLVFMCKMMYDFIQRQKKISENEQSLDCFIAHSSDFMSILYKFSSNTIMLTKVLLVVTLTSYLHSLSRRPLKALYSLPSSGYNLEVSAVPVMIQRLMDQVYYSRVSLSGLQIFYVTRGIIISMLSTMITYELVWLQWPVNHNQ